MPVTVLIAVVMILPLLTLGLVALLRARPEDIPSVIAALAQWRLRQSASGSILTSRQRADQAHCSSQPCTLVLWLVIEDVFAGRASDVDGGHEELPGDGR